MSDKKIFNKRKNKNKNRNNRSNRRNSDGPSPVTRIDDSIIREVSLLLDLGATEELIKKQYGLCYSQIDFIKKHQQKWEILTKNKEE